MNPIPRPQSGVHQIGAIAKRFPIRSGAAGPGIYRCRRRSGPRGPLQAVGTGRARSSLSEWHNSSPVDTPALSTRS